MFHCSDSRALLILCRPYRASQSPVGTTDIQRRWSHAEPLPQPAGGQPLRISPSQRVQGGVNTPGRPSCLYKI